MQASGRPLRVAILNWRDTSHPEGGGSERYVERIAADLVADGCQVEVLCARHPQAGARSERDGVQFRHAGGRFGVYLRALATLARRRLGGSAPDVVLDVHNGIPFFARLVAGCPVVVLVHHVHREQWQVVFGPGLARIGWFLESTVSPWVHRGCQYVAVSRVTRRELIGLGVDAGAVAVIHNGGPQPSPLPHRLERDPAPSLVVLGRLVPHKRVEQALRVLAELHPAFPGLRLRVIGAGWWRAELEAEARRLDVTDRVEFTGFVDEVTKAQLLARSWLMLAPSVQEGWGLMVIEAAAHGVPAIAYRSGGGLGESIEHGRTGVLIGDELRQLVERSRDLLCDHALRERLGSQARERAGTYDWRTASLSMHLLLRRAADRLPVTDEVDPVPEPPLPLRLCPLLTQEVGQKGAHVVAAIGRRTGRRCWRSG